MGDVQPLSPSRSLKRGRPWEKEDDETPSPSPPRLLTRLPDDCLLYILSFLDTASFVRCAGVCRALRVLTSLPESRTTLDLAPITPDTVVTTLLSRYTHLTALNAPGCTAVMRSGLGILARFHTHLEHLSIPVAARIVEQWSSFKGLRIQVPALCQQADDATLAAVISHNRRLHFLDLSGCALLGRKTFAAIASLTRLTTLAIAGSVLLVPPDILDPARLSFADTLTHLTLVDVFVGDDALERIFRSCASSLRYVRFGYSFRLHILDASLRIPSSRTFNTLLGCCKRLESINFLCCDVSLDPKEVKADSLPHATHLDMPQSALNDFSLDLLSDACPSLQHVDLGSCFRLDGHSLERLVRTHQCITHLSLGFRGPLSFFSGGGTAADDATVRAIGNCLPSLRVLQMNGCEEVTPGAWLEFVRCDLSSLEELGIIKTQVNDSVLTEILRSAPRLRQLAFDECPNITSHGLSAFFAQLPDHRLQSLSMCQVITCGGLLAEVPPCPSITSLNIVNCSVSPEDINTLPHVFPNLHKLSMGFTIGDTPCPPVESMLGHLTEHRTSPLVELNIYQARVPAHALLEFLRTRGSTLRRLTWRGCHMAKEDVKAEECFCSLPDLCPSLKFLDITGLFPSRFWVSDMGQVLSGRMPRCEIHGSDGRSYVHGEDPVNKDMWGAERATVSLSPTTVVVFSKV